MSAVQGPFVLRPMAVPAWHASAACRPGAGHDPSLWASTDGAELLAARRICRAVCAVREVCLADALGSEITHHTGRWGMRGGLSPRERTAHVRNAAERCS